MMNDHMNGHGHMNNQIPAKVTDNVQRRRNAHTAAEKKRRDSINKGFEDLQKVVPEAMYEFDPETGQKISKPIILKRTIDHIEKLGKTHDELIDEYKSLKSEMDALNVINECYNHIYPEERYSLSSTEINNRKLHMMIDFYRTQFSNFDQLVDCSDYRVLCQAIIHWMQHEKNASQNRSLYNQNI